MGKTREEINAYNREYYKINKKRDAEKRQAALVRYRQNNKEKIKESQRRYYQTSFLNRTIANAQRRAEAEGLPFDITVDDIVLPEFCPIYKDIKLIVGMAGGKDCSPSIDKIIPELGYVKGNIQIVSWKANRHKGDASLEDLVTLGEWAKNVSNSNL